MLVRRLVSGVLAVLGTVLVVAPVPAAAAPAARRITATVAGVTFAVELPATWNGTLLLWSHGYNDPTQQPPAPLPADPTVTNWLVQNGYAVAGSAYPNLPWPSRDALRDQLALLDWFGANVGRPRHTVAWGESLGGLVTALLAERYPDRFAGALPMCGPVEGAVGWYNALLDTAFALKTLLWHDKPVQLVHVADPAANQALTRGLLREALNDPASQARLALANALGDVPGWADSLAPRPADPGEQVIHQYLYDRYQNGTFLFGPARAQAEAGLGGNPSWNIGVDYAAQLAKSSQGAEVTELYRRAGLDLQADLARLAAAPRIAPDPAALVRLARDGSTLGLVSVPTLTLHTTGDGTIVPESERWYADRAAALGRSANLRQAFVDRANHCFFTPAEQLAALGALFHRVDTGHWGDTAPEALNAVADGFGPELRQMWSYYADGTATVPGGFVSAAPQRFPR